MDSGIRIGLIDDDRVTREAMRSLLDNEPGFSCVVSEGSFETALPRIAATMPHVVLLDIGLPGIQGDEAVGILREKLPAVQVIMLTVHSEQDRIFRSICRGACGYLLKQMPPAKLVEAIRDAVSGGAPMSPRVARNVIALLQKIPVPAGSGESLSPQEVRVLRLLADGHQYQAAATELGITINTLRNYIRHIYEKLHVHTKSEAVSKAMRAGILS